MSTRIGDLLKEGLSRGIEGLCDSIFVQLGISIVKKTQVQPNLIWRRTKGLPATLELVFIGILAKSLE
jgi:hypothetical protein